MIQSEETQEFIAQSIFRMEENLPRIEKCFKELSEEEIWQKPNSSSNSVGNLVLHLCGNITQYIIASLGEKTDLRNRDLEFSKTDGFNKKELLDQLTSTINSAIQVIKHCNSADLLKIRSVQGFNFSGMGIIIHVSITHSNKCFNFSWNQLICFFKIEYRSSKVVSKQFHSTSFEISITIFIII